MADQQYTIRRDWKTSGPIFPDERSDIREEVHRILGDDAEAWLKENNVRLGGKTPEEVIQAGEHFWVRDILRSYLAVGSS